MPRKVCVVVTARPSYSRIRSALVAIREHPDLELQLVVAASALLDRYGNAVRVIENEGFQIDRRVYMIVEGENLVTSAKSTGHGLAELSTVFDNLGPDVVLTVGDRFETIATAVAAAYLNLPLVHVQGGEVTGSIDEKVRHSVTKLADLHFVATDQAAERVRRMGEQPDRIFVTGCPSIDVAQEVAQDPKLDFDSLFAKFGGVGREFDLSRGYVVVMQHPVTTEYHESRRQIDETLHAVSESDLPTLWFWPNVDAGSDATSAGIRRFRELHELPHVHFFKNMPPEDFLRLLLHCRCMLGNSSVAIRECSYLGVPAVNIGSRQQGRERGANVVDVAHDRSAILEALHRQTAAPRPEPDPIFGDGSAGPRIAELLATAELSIEKRITY
jgi:UDP-hydrolysing UDP-N-acetyl-D-glucosamine 2-epimerase